MTTSGNADAGGAVDDAGTGLRAETRDEVFDVLADVLSWELPPVRWKAVGEILTSLTAATAAGDLDAVRAAADELVVSAPVRVSRIGSGSMEAAPVVVREQVAEVQRSIGSTTREAAPDENEK